MNYKTSQCGERAGVCERVRSIPVWEMGGRSRKDSQRGIWGRPWWIKKHLCLTFSWSLHNLLNYFMMHCYIYMERENQRLNLLEAKCFRHNSEQNRLKSLSLRTYILVEGEANHKNINICYKMVSKNIRNYLALLLLARWHWSRNLFSLMLIFCIKTGPNAYYKWMS